MESKFEIISKKPLKDLLNPMMKKEKILIRKTHVSPRFSTSSLLGKKKEDFFQRVWKIIDDDEETKFMELIDNLNVNFKRSQKTL